MCGISGIINLDGEYLSKNLILHMNHLLFHRGPDDSGLWIDKNIGLGHTRLSIIDLSPAGKQPMISSDGSMILSYNGEIYNFIELKAELINFGITFKRLIPANTIALKRTLLA